MTEESVKVAVRVRPFNQREKDRNAKLIIKMEGQNTSIEDPDNPSDPPKTFAFDYSYWSHDGFVEQPNGYLEPKSSKSNYASQKKVFDDLGRGVLDNAFEGFNCSLFAYGQTGSGKSYSMVGYGANKGIVPVTCEVLFDKISKSQNKNEITFSMLEIYNEQVNDLLSKDNQRGGLQVRQHPSQGYFYAQGLKRVPVGSYGEIERRIEEGTANRTVASTNMNATSSRAHTVVTITFDQIFTTSAGEVKKSSVINLVDLAGSERADSTGATGDRLKEGANINKSLSALGNVISSLAEQSSGKKKVLIPYRDSVLTKLLQNALGGNSKTVMIAALSPADINYSETLSTLRYADRAKRIKTKAIVNENPVDKLIRELKEENDRLKMLIESGKINFDRSTSNLSKEELEAMKKEMFEQMKAQLVVNQKMIDENKTSFKERLQKAQQETANEAKEVARKEERKVKTPYLTNLNEDPLLSYVICHFIDSKQVKVGRSADSAIQLSGLGILTDHAILSNQGGEITMKPCQLGVKIKVNGNNVEDVHTLQHNDRILFGSSNMFVFINPAKQAASKEPIRISWEMAQKEIAEAKGFSVKNSSLTKDQQAIQEEIVELLPVVTEVNAISDELNKHRLFENMNEWLWDKGKFMNRKFLMQDLYQNYLDGEEFILKLKKEEDPFWEPPEDLFIGLCNFFLQSLVYCMDFEDKAFIMDYKGEEIGTMGVKIVPCSDNGHPLGEDAYIDNPTKLLGKPFNFSIEISSCEVANRAALRGFKIKFKVFGDRTEILTPVVEQSKSAKFNFHHIVNYKSMSKEHVNFFENGCITFIVYAVQKDTGVDKKLAGLSTRELKILRENEKNEIVYKHEMQMNGGATGGGTDIDPSHIKLELSLLQRKYDILEEHEMQIQKLCNYYLKQSKLSKELKQVIDEIVKILNKKKAS